MPAAHLGASDGQPFHNPGKGRVADHPPRTSGSAPLCYAKILSGPEFLSFSRDRDKGLSKRQSTCETRSRCSRYRS